MGQKQAIRIQRWWRRDPPGLVAARERRAAAAEAERLEILRFEQYVAEQGERIKYYMQAVLRDCPVPAIREVAMSCKAGRDLAQEAELEHPERRAAEVPLWFEESQPEEAESKDAE